MIEELIKYNKLLEKLHVIKKNKNFIFSNDSSFLNDFVMPMGVLIFSSVLIFVTFHNQIVASTGNINDETYYFLEHSNNEALVEKIIQHHTNNKSIKELVKEKLLKNENHIINL